MVPLADGRPNLVARIGGRPDKAPLAFTGHTDTVPLGLKPWTVPPHGGVIKDGKLWGRGASDMKSGVAAFVTSAIKAAPRLAGTAGVVLYITAGEETGSAGAFVLAERGMKGQAGALVVPSRPATADVRAQGRLVALGRHQRRDGARFDAARGRQRGLTPRHAQSRNSRPSISTWHVIP